MVGHREQVVQKSYKPSDDAVFFAEYAKKLVKSGIVIQALGNGVICVLMAAFNKQNLYKHTLICGSEALFYCYNFKFETQETTRFKFFSGESRITLSTLKECSL